MNDTTYYLLAYTLIAALLAVEGLCGYQLIKELNDVGITIIMISHDMAAAKRYATHILHIGREVEFHAR